MVNRLFLLLISHPTLATGSSPNCAEINFSQNWTCTAALQPFQMMQWLPPYRARVPARLNAIFWPICKGWCFAVAVTMRVMSLSLAQTNARCSATTPRGGGIWTQRDQLTLEWSDAYAHYHATMMQTLIIGKACEKHQFMHALPATPWKPLKRPLYSENPWVMSLQLMPKSSTRPNGPCKIKCL